MAYLVYSKEHKREVGISFQSVFVDGKAEVVNIGRRMKCFESYWIHIAIKPILGEYGVWVNCS